jgi:hypothetical protein
MKTQTIALCVLVACAPAVPTGERSERRSGDAPNAYVVGREVPDPARCECDVDGDGRAEGVTVERTLPGMRVVVSNGRERLAVAELTTGDDFRSLAVSCVKLFANRHRSIAVRYFERKNGQNNPEFETLTFFAWTDGRLTPILGHHVLWTEDAGGPPVRGEAARATTTWRVSVCPGRRPRVVFEPSPGEPERHTMTFQWNRRTRKFECLSHRLYGDGLPKSRAR